MNGGAIHVEASKDVLAGIDLHLLYRLSLLDALIVPRLRGGSAGWATAHPVRDEQVDGLILAPEEIAWLQACWTATRA